MAKKQTEKKKKAPKALPILRTYRVERPAGTEEILAHRVDNWDNCLTFSIEVLDADDETEIVLVRGFAQGQWLEYSLLAKPSVEPPADGA
jgi:hypothetical protein